MKIDKIAFEKTLGTIRWLLSFVAIICMFEVYSVVMVNPNVLWYIQFLVMVFIWFGITYSMNINTLGIK